MGPMSDGDPAKPGRQCVTCGRTIDWNANVCQYCGHDFRVPAPGPPSQPRTAKPAIGGVLIILAGLLALGMGGLIMAFDSADLEEYGYTPADYGMSFSEIEEMMGVCGVILLLLAVVAILGGVFAIMRKSFAFSIIGGICAMIGIGFVIGTILGLIGLILVAVSKDEF